MEIVEETVAGAVLLKPLRRVDHSGAKVLGDRLMLAAGTGPMTIIVDCAGLEYINSAGLRVLLVAAKAAKDNQGQLLICGLSPFVKEVFTVSGLMKILTIVESRADALAMS